MTTKPLFDEGRVARTATFIAEELRTLLERKCDGHMNRRHSEAGPDRKDITNLEYVAATIRALAMVQIEMIGGDLKSLTNDTRDEEDDKESAKEDAEVVHLRRISENLNRPLMGVR